MSLQEVLLPDVRAAANAYPCHEFEHWDTPPPMMGVRVETKVFGPPPFLPLVTDEGIET